MKKLELNQMESLEGGVTKEQWCLVGSICACGAGFLAGGPAGSLGIMAAAAWALSC